MAEWTTQRFPQFEAAIRRLAEDHRGIEGEPLHLAISYGPDRDQEDVFLLEVIGGPFVQGINSERELFETAFTSTPGFPMGMDQKLHLVLTTPEEFQTALREQWPSALEIVEAIRRGDYSKLQADEIVEKILAKIDQCEGAARG